ncbi:hypothetical protein CDN99_06595 [Roseateles aquatilis]|uniref:Uncharacterized protein n=1 Tax=Roseateles aquatilis TaxID=431061 RepID=A0A246JHD7_9BURK|nr:hypothetical protein [Roseateles aquatilis]OWQ92021.1 hypothetical protein CDN99_06595 [Roseateles aquatilis]
MTTLDLSRERRVDWPRVIANLQRTGMSPSTIADWVGVGRKTITDYARDDLPAEPAHWVGHCLIVLWCERCGTTLADLPTRLVQPSVSQVLREHA